MRQTKAFLPTVLNRGRAKKARDLSRYDMGILVRNLTGHAFLRRHNFIIDAKTTETHDEISDNFLEPTNGNNTPTLNPLHEADLTRPENAKICRLCRDASSLETPYHLYTECPSVWKLRRDHLHTYHMHDENPQWKPQTFVDFFKTLDLEN